MDPSINPTNLIYFSNTYVFSIDDAVVLATGEAPEKSCSFVILDKTIFYPQGGGQPADSGVISSQDGTTQFTVSDVRLKDNIVYHYGQFSAGNLLSSGTTVLLRIDEEKRRLHAQLHSAGHLVDVAVRAILPELKPGRGCHFPSGAYVEYEGTVPEAARGSLKASLQEQLNRLIIDGIHTKVCESPVDDIPSLCGGWMPDYLTDKSKLYRVVMVGGLGCPCGGTHVSDTSQLKGLELTGLKFTKGKMKVSYHVKQ